MKKEEKDDYTILFRIERDYSSFHQFYESEKHLIYEKILESYEKMISDNQKEKKLVIVATAKGKTFDTNFIINKDNAEALLGTLKPYFEENEEYEYCGRIIEIYQQLI